MAYLRPFHLKKQYKTKQNTTTTKTPKPTNKQKSNKPTKNQQMAMLYWQHRFISASPKLNGKQRLYTLDSQPFSEVV